MARAAGKASALQRPRVILALLLLLGLTCVMLLDGYLRAEVGGDERVRDGASASKVPDKVLNGGPILTFRNGKPVTQTIPKKTIVLTFDDGPNPTYTPTVLKILKKYDVPGTFFLVGSMVSRYPDIVKQMVAQGEEVGIHTFTHVDLSYQSDARIKREMQQTQLALAGAAGITTTLFRAPYSSETDAIATTATPSTRSSAPPATPASSSTPTATTGSSPASRRSSSGRRRPGLRAPRCSSTTPVVCVRRP
jgi:peptidoglycan/xylan/chitin deacetylase (PgdA/CDA1 family)